MDKGYLLSSGDVAILKEMVEAYKGRNHNTRNRGWWWDPPPMAPEIYIARTPHGGISGYVETAGTGTGSVELRDSVPNGNCEIFRITPSGSSFYPEIVGTTQRVFNLSTTALLGDRWVQVYRDKFGTWLFDPLAVFGSGGSSGGTGSGSTARDVVIGCILTRSANVSVVSGAAPALSNWDAPTYDAYGFYSAGQPSRLTVPAGYAGVYTLAGYTGWAINAVGERYTQINKNNVELFGDTRPGMTGGVYTTHQPWFRDFLELQVGDFLDIRYHQTSGGPLNVVGSAADPLHSPYFSLRFIGVKGP